MKNKLISWLLAVVFIVAALPVSALPVFAALTDDSGYTATYSIASNNITINYTLSSSQSTPLYLYYYTSAALIDDGDVLNAFTTTIDRGTNNSNTGTISIYYGSTTTVYFYFDVRDSNTGSTIEINNDRTKNTTGLRVIEPSSTTTTAPTLTGFTAYRDFYTSGAVNIEFTANKAGTLYYGTTKNFTSSDSSSFSYVANVKTTKTIQLSNSVKTIYYRAAKSSSETNSDYIYAFNINNNEWASSTSVKFTYSCDGGGKLYYTFTKVKYDNKNNAPLSDFMTINSATAGTFTLTTDGEGAQYLYYKYSTPNEKASNAVQCISVTAYSVKTAPTITEMSITNRKSTTATAVFTSNIDGTIYYKVATSMPSKSAMTSGMTIKTGTNSFNISGLSTTSTRLYYYTADATGTVTSNISSVAIPQYSESDTTGPVLTNNSIKPFTSNSNTTVTLSFTSTEAGTLYYILSQSKYDITKIDQIISSEKYEIASISSGSNSISKQFNTAAIAYAYYYAVDAVGNPSSLYKINTSGTDDSAPTITNVYVLHPTTKGGNVYFTSDKKGTFYYGIYTSSDIAPTKTNLKSNISMDSGSNNFYITLSDSKSYILYYYAVSEKEVETEISYVTIPEYSTTAVSIVKIKSVSQSPGTNTYVNGDAGVTLTISASSDVSDTLVFEYDFGDGKWTTSNSKKFTESTTIAAGGIRARVIDDTNSSNWAVYPSEYIISNIDNGKPTINSVDRTPTDTTKATDSVKITVNAIDTASGTGGKASGIYGYSFDGGVTYQTSNVKEYKSNTTIAINKICVKDSVGNVSYYSNSITINNVDSTAPSINNITTSRSTVDVGTIKFISSEAGIFHYEIVMNYAIQDSSKEYLVSNESVLVEGSNTFTISGLKAYGEGQIALAFYLEDSAGNTSLLYTAFIPAYGEEDKKAPEIVSVTLNTTSPTNQPVSVVVEAKDDVDLADKAYSFDGGKTWQQSNEYAYKENTVITAGTIVVRDAAENETKYNKELKITNIDTTLPTMSVSVTASAGNVIIRVTASDDVSLQSAAYSFDGGITWQAASTKTYSKSTTIASEMIQVRDTAGNIRKYATVITQGQMDALLGDEWSNPYTDVKTTDWYYSYVQTVVEAGLFQGVSSTSFSPNLNMTRAMFVTVLGRLEGINAGDYTTNKYSDVSTGQWYTGYVAWATQNGIVNGYDNGKFGINDNITREQMCTMIVRYLDYLELTSDLNVMNITFADKAQISDWAERSVSICQQLGLVVGSDNKFRPKDGSTRAEVATVFTRIINAFEY